MNVVQMNESVVWISELMVWMQECLVWACIYDVQASVVCKILNMQPYEAACSWHFLTEIH